MSKAEDFIRENTKDYSNQYNFPEYFENGIKRLKEYQPWLTPDQTRRAVEIAREEIYEWLEENAVNFVALADNEHPAIGDTKAFYGTKCLIYWLKQAIEDE